MALGDVIASLAVSLSLETAAFEKGADVAEKRLAQSQKRFEAMGKSLQGLGTKLSIAVTAPFVAFGVSATKAALESRDAMGQVESALKSMGGAAGRTKEQLSDLASKGMRSSLYDDDEILRKVTANLLTFGKISGKAFDQAQQAAIDLSARLGTDLQSSTVLIGKALNDPIKGISALTRVGVAFTEQQKKQIKAMAESGDVAGAQGLILAELNKQYGGAAQAALDAAGPMAKLKKQFDEISETVGEAILPAIERLVPYLQSAADWFLKLSPRTQTFIVAAAGIAAALGPVLIGLGALVKLAAPVLAGFQMIAGAIAAVEGVGIAGAVAGWAAAFGSLAASLAPLVLPLAAVAAAGYLIYQNWDKIAPALEEFWQTVQTTLGPPLQELVATITSAFSELWNGPLGEMIRAVGSRLVEFQVAYSKVMGPVLLGAIKVAIDTFANLFRSIGDGVRAINALLKGDFASAFHSIGSIINRALSGIPAKMLEIGRDIVLGLARGIRNNATAVWDALKGVISSGVQRAKDFLGIKSPSRVFMEIGAFIGDGLAIGIEGGKGKVDAATRKLTEAARRAAEETKALFARLFPEIEKANNYRDDLKRIESAPVSDADKSEARRRLSLEAAGVGGDVPISLLKEDQALDVTKGLDVVLDKMDVFGKKAGAVNVAVAKSFKDMADATVQSLQNLANSIKGGGFLDILSAVVGLGLQLGSIGAFGKGVAARINAPKIPGYAGGTNFHPGGLALLGEQGPEVVDLPRGSRVYPHGTGPTQSVHVTVGVDPRNGNVTAFVDGRLAATAPLVIDAGGRAGVAKMAYQQRRRVA
jgi:hypothetical protein